MDVHLRDFRSFAAVADELNFPRAAERLHLSQPALSKQIRGLEIALRAQLFQRDGRQVALTAAGTARDAVARDLLRSWDEGVAAVAEAAAQEQRKFGVGTLTSIGRALYPAVIGRFGRYQPGWQAQLRSFGWGDPTAGLRDQVTDVAFVWLPVDDGDIEAEVLATERRFTAMSARHRLAGRARGDFHGVIDGPVAAPAAPARALRHCCRAPRPLGGPPPGPARAGRQRGP